MVTTFINWVKHIIICESRNWKQQQRHKGKFVLYGMGATPRWKRENKHIFY